MINRFITLAGASVLVISVMCAPIASASPTEFQKCLKEHGVNAKLPEHPPRPPKGGKHTPPAPPGVDKGTWEKAFQACRQYAPPPPR